MNEKLREGLHSIFPVAGGFLLFPSSPAPAESGCRACSLSAEKPSEKERIPPWEIRNTPFFWSLWQEDSAIRSLTPPVRSEEHTSELQSPS